MSDIVEKTKGTRRKRRVIGTATPPRIELVLRLEQSTYDEMQTRLKRFKGSQNRYIETAIKLACELYP
jgi:vacuolar-type H+-ATPase catalytic subunit A/Vma1